MPLYRPSDTVGARGLRSALIRHDWRHDKCHESWFCLFREKLKKLASWIVIIFFTTKKSRFTTKISRIVIFFFIRSGPYNGPWCMYYTSFFLSSFLFFSHPRPAAVVSSLLTPFVVTRKWKKEHQYIENSTDFRLTNQFASSLIDSSRSLARTVFSLFCICFVFLSLSVECTQTAVVSTRLVEVTFNGFILFHGITIMEMTSKMQRITYRYS